MKAYAAGTYCNEGLNSFFGRCSAGFKIRCLVGLATTLPMNNQKAADISYYYYYYYYNYCYYCYYFFALEVGFIRIFFFFFFFLNKTSLINRTQIQ